MDFLILKLRNSFQNKNNRKATHSFVPRSLIFILQKEALKFNDIYVIWRSPKTDLVTILNLENQSFENIVFLHSNFK